MKCDDLAIIEQTVGDGIANSASPGFIFGRGGNAAANSWLINNEVPSNITGIPFGLSNGKILQIWAASQDIDTYDINIYHHLGDEISLTLMTTISIVATRQQFFGPVDFGIVLVPQNVQLAARIVNGNAKNPKCSVFVGGI